MLVAITGVSGSGKSTLVHDVLYQALAAAKRQTAESRRLLQTGATLEGDDLIDDVVLVDQSPIGRTPRSNPVTYIKVFDAIRELFASLPKRKKRGYTAGHFSSTFRADAAKPARATARSRSRCSSWPTSNWFAKNAKARASSSRFWTFAITARTFTKC